MFRPFQLRDVALLRQLNDRSLPLNAALMLTQPSTPLRGALAHQLLRRNSPTYVWRPRGSSVKAFVQFKLNEDKTQAQLLWLGSAESKRRQVIATKEVWASVVQQLAIQLSQVGVHSLVAEVAEDGPEQVILRDIGFSNFSRQTVWTLTANDVIATYNGNLMQQRKRTHDWDIELLYAHTVPNMIRMIEPHPPIGKNGWICYEGHQLAAYANMESGRKGHWLQMFVSLDAKVDAKTIVSSIVQQNPPTPDMPIHCVLRNYQEWLHSALEHSGFQHRVSQAVMVRRTVQHVQKTESSLEKVLQGNRARAQTTPIIHKSQNGSSKRRTKQRILEVE